VHPARGASRGALFHPEGRRERGKERGASSASGGASPSRGKGEEEKRKREKTSRSFNVSLHRLEGKRKREKKRTSRPLPSLFRGTPDLLEDLGGSPPPG